jgi:hypothetical protein
MQNAAIMVRVSEEGQGAESMGCLSIHCDYKSGPVLGHSITYEYMCCSLTDRRHVVA